MKTRQQQLFGRMGRRTFGLKVLVLMFGMLAMTTMAQADRMKDNAYFSMTNKGDHLHFSLQMADADSRNTYCDWGGILCSSGSSSVEVIILYSGDGDDDGDNWKIHAMDRNGNNWGGVSVITNIYPSGESKINCSSDATTYTIKKSNKYPKVEIDFYWPASMANKTWNFTYQFNHVRNNGSDGGWQKMNLGSTYLGRTAQDLGYHYVNSSDYSIVRERMDKMKFTVPQIPDDVPSRVADYRWHEAWYKLTCTYTMPSGTKVTRTIDDLKCVKGSTKTYDIDIPAEVQKYKRVDISVASTDKLLGKNGQVFWNVSNSYFRNDAFDNAPQPRGLTAEYRQFDSEAVLAWEAFATGDKYIQATEPYVYRIETNASGTPLSGKTWQKRGTLSEVGTAQNQSYTDQQLVSGTYYRYMVVNVPKEWMNKGVSATDLNSPSDDLLARLPYVLSDVVNTAPQVSIFDLVQDTSVTDKVRLTWQYSRVPVTAKNVSFQVLRRTTADGEWTPYGNVTAPSNPTAGDVSSFIDTNLPDTRARYEYKVALELNNGTHRFESDAITAGFLSGTLVNGIDVTKGSHEGTVRVTWRAKQVGTANSAYVLSRRYAGSTDDFMQIYTANGTAEQYVYEDNTAMPGYYYEYKVDVYSGDDGDRQNMLTDVGFCQARGVVSGAVTFGAGTAVKDVRMNLIASDDAGDAVRGYSKRIDGASTGITWNADSEELTKVFGSNRDYTVQMFVRPDKGLNAGTIIGNIPSEGLLSLGSPTNNGYEVYIAGQGTGLTLAKDDYSLLTVSRSGSQLKVQVNSNTPVTLKVAQKTPADPFCIGGVEGISAEQGFRGNVTEVRIFDHALNDSEMSSYADRTLSGRENGLRLYWPMDEGLNRYVFDASYANDVPNSRHASVGANISTSVLVPTQKQLSRYGKTNDKGEYIIRSIPFAGSGTGYRVVPELGIHEFSPNTRSMFISPTSLTANNVDFVDTSSFPMEGYIYYAGTNIPAQGIQLYIDGELVSAQGEIKKTDANGYYSISVPIGQHFVEAKLDGHTMVAGGRYPETGTYNFERAVTHNFSDSTLVNFVGRVGGGEHNDTLAVGFAESRNNIGMATVTLRINNESFSFNCADDHISPATATRTWESDTTSINSRAWTAAGIESKYINIRTDSVTGEFSALLPPLKYAIKSVTVDKNSDIEFISGQEVDLTNPRAERADTLIVSTTNGVRNKKIYHYNAKKVFTHWAPPQLDIEESNNAAGVFGISSISEVTAKGDTLTIEHLWTLDKDGKPSYLFGYPVYRMGEEAEYKFYAYEAYTNHDAKEPQTEKIPLKGQVLNIVNEMASDQDIVFSVTEEVKDYAVGDVYEPKTNEYKLGADGKGTYRWQAGLPNITSPFTRHLTATMTRKDRTYILAEMDAVVLGSITTGNNFVTKGPDHVDFVLRDPPGSKSKTTLKRGRISRTETYSSGGFYDNSTFITTNIFGNQLKMAAGAGVMLITSQEVKGDFRAGVHVEYNHNSSHEHTITTTYSNAISTGTAYPYVSTKGDVYVGTSSNLLFGICRNLHVVRQGNGYALAVDDAQSLGSTVATDFMYSQYELETVMIPKWKDQRNAFMKTAIEVADSAAAYAYKNNGKRAVYLTWIKPGHKEYGISKYRWAAPIDEKKVEVSEVDSVQWCTNQIQAWERIIRLNEEDKVLCMQERKGWNNFSIDGANTYTFSERRDTTDVWRYRDNWKVGAIVGGDFGFRWFGLASFGCIVNITTENGKAWSEGDGNDKTNYTEWEYTFSDGNRDTDISVNQYDSNHSSWSKGFSVFGGQTYNPYHDADSTHYYTPKTQLNAATVQMEQPELRISVNGSNPAKTITVTDLPSGKEVNLTLHCTNQAFAHQGLDFSYNLVIVEKTNDKGLQILMDGVPINGRSVRIPQSETVTKQITIRQTDESILNYDGVRLRFCSQYQPLLIKDEVTINAHFTPSSSPIDLAAEESILNQETLTRSKGNVVLKLSNFNRLFKNLKNIGVQYRYGGNPQWTNVHTYVTNKTDSLDESYSLLPETSTIRYTLNMLNDISYPQGTYTFRAYTTTPYGDDPNDAATVYSDEVTVVKDNVSPRALTTPTPANGILGYGDNLSVEFNEDIVPGYVGDKNVIVTAKLNRQETDHEVSMQFSRRGGTANTESPLFLTGDFSIDFWINWSDGEYFLRHGDGFNTFKLGININGHPTVTIGGSGFVSSETIPKDTWTYLVMSYRSSDMTFSMLAQYGTKSVDLFSDQKVSLKDVEYINYMSDNRLYIGGFTGRIHDLSLFNIYRDVHEAAATKYQSKDNYSYGLAHYWPMDEGHGEVAADTRRTNNIMTDISSWDIDNENYCVRLDSNEGMKVSIADINTRPGESYAIECWANDDESSTLPENVIFETGSTPAKKLRLYFDKEKLLKLDYGTQTQTMASVEDFPDLLKYNHYALNVVRGQAASFYINGQRVAVIAETDVPIIDGAEIKLAQGIDFFDELRIWHAAISEDRFKAGIYNCIDTAEVYARGLVAYYPFEKSAVVGGVKTKVFTLENMAPRSQRTMPNAPMTMLSQYNENRFTPPLKNAPEEERLIASPVASERKVVINLTGAGIKPRDIEGTTLNITMADIRDLHGNSSQPIRWSAYVQQNTLKWMRDSVNIIKKYGDSYTFDVDIENKSGQTEYYTLYNMPQWLTLVDSEHSDDIEPLKTKTLRFQVNPLVAVGIYDITIGLQGNNEILEPLRIVMKVSGEKPQWAVDPTKYDHNMAIIGQVYINGILMENPESMVAAFIGSECRGVASPDKVRGAAFITMTVYGDDYKTKDQQKAVTFRIWDASKGVAYTDAQLAVDGSPINVTFQQDKMLGSFDMPAIWTKTDKVEQLIPIHQNWNWIAFGVEPESRYLDHIFSSYADWMLLIKNREAFSDYNGAEWNGKLTPTVNAMYKLKVTRLPNTQEAAPNAQLSVSGRQPSALAMPVTLKKGWNWIAYTPLTTMTIGEALAGANPQKGDIVKSQTGLSIHGASSWEGSLQSLEGGHGYMYYSTDSVQKQFVYPTASSASTARMIAPRRAADDSPHIFASVDPSLYPNNMTMVVQLIAVDGAPVDTCEVAAFVGDECRGVTRASSNGLYYLIISGEGSGQPMTLRTCLNGEIVTIDKTQTFVSDDNIGTSWEPYVIDLSNALSGISNITADDADDTDWWTLQGFKIGRKPTQPGVYIHHGQKVTIKRAK